MTSQTLYFTILEIEANEIP